MANKQTVINRKRPYTMSNFLVSVYLVIMFSFFEMFLSKQFTYARTDKFLFFVIATAVFALPVILIHAFSKTEKDLYKLYNPAVFSLSVPDVSIFAFYISACFSTIFSDHVFHSFMGNSNVPSSGRDNGLLLLTAYVVMYFFVSRFFYYKEYVLNVFIIFGSIISALAVINFFYIDPIGLFNGYSQWYVDNFSSTIGNKNLVSSYMCIFLPVAMIMFVVTKKRYSQILCAVGIILGYCGLLVSGSNSAYIGFATMLIVMLAVCIRHLDMLTKFMLSVTIMFSSGLLLRLFSLVMSDRCKGFEDIGSTLVYSNNLFIIIAVTALVTLCLFLLNSFTKASSHWPKNTLMIIVIVTGVAIACLILYLLYYYTFVDTTTYLGPFERLLRFNERWGTHRGYYWIHGLKIFFESDIITILFGTGCDTFYFMFEPLFPQLVTKFNESSTNCAHNEYINYLTTQGIIGLTTYLSLIISTIVCAFKSAKNDKIVLIFVLPVITYCAQAVVNLYQPITTPFLFIFIALCEGMHRYNIKLSENR